MREILFRGKTNKGEWVEGSYYKQTEFYGSTVNYHIIISSKDELEDNMIDFNVVNPKTVGQFTGMLDKNGKKIFEGDILNGESGLHRVYYDRVYCRFEWARLKGNYKISFADYADGYEIVGNIYDNPELFDAGVQDN